MTISITDQVRQIIAHQALLDLDDVTEDATLQSLGIDSLGLVESVFAIEETFDIEVPFNANNPADGRFDLTSVATVVTEVTGLIAAKNAG